MKNAIYKYLSHHYILQRSVIIIVDSSFDSMAYSSMAAGITHAFFDRMPASDYFGLISLGRGNTDHIPLEQKGKNTKTKKAALLTMIDVEP